jgi:acetyl esterase/lipase
MRKVTGELDSGKTDPSPAIECWIPGEGATGIGLLVLAGGSYAGHTEYEASGYAEYFCRQGIASFVVRYRLGSEGHRHPAMLEDAFAAIATVRSRAGAFGVDRNRLGLIGSSAGGHLAAHALTAWNDYPEGRLLRADFGVLCYPVIVSEGPFSHRESIMNLAGSNPPPELLASLSCEKRVTAETPPCFLWHTGRDKQVPLENSVAFASALRAHDVPFELHLYQEGGHGLGLDAGVAWGPDCVRWIKETASRGPV